MMFHSQLGAESIVFGTNKMMIHHCDIWHQKLKKMVTLWVTLAVVFVWLAWLPLMGKVGGIGVL
jgi:hypothetical protein